MFFYQPSQTDAQTFSVLKLSYEHPPFGTPFFRPATTRAEMTVENGQENRI